MLKREYVGSTHPPGSWIEMSSLHDPGVKPAKQAGKQENKMFTDAAINAFVAPGHDGTTGSVQRPSA